MRATLFFGFIFTVLSGSIYFPTIGKLLEQFPDSPDKNLIAVLILTVPAFVAAITSLIVGRFVETHEKKRVLFYALAAFGTLGFLGVQASNLIEVLIIRLGIGASIGALATGLTNLLIMQKTKTREFPRVIMFLIISTFLLFSLNSWLAESYWKVGHYLHLLAFLYLPFFTLFITETESDKKAEEKKPLRPALEQEVLEKRSLRQDFTHNLFITFVLSFSLFFMPRYLDLLITSKVPEISGITGRLIALVTVAGIIGAWWSRRASFRKTHISLETLSLFCIAASYATCTFIPNTIIIFPALALLGFGIGLYFSNALMWNIELSTNKHLSRNISEIVSMIYLGQFLAPFVIWFSLESFGIQPILFIASGVLALLFIFDLFRYFRIRNETIL